MGSKLVAEKHRLYIVKSKVRPFKRCRVHLNLPLYVLMDRVCLLCHEMFSHERPNMRADCTSNCFKSEHFKRCLNVFAPGNEFENIMRELE